MPVHIQMRRGSASEWTVSNTLLAEGEMGLELDTGYYKFGNGVNNWGDLSYSQVSAEVVEDIIGAMVDSNTETNITVTYNDTTAKLNFSSTSDVTISNVQTFSNKSIALGSNTVTGTLAEFNTALTNADFATLTGSESLTNKTITSPIVTGLTLNDSSIVFEGATADAFETTLTVTDPSADRTITVQDGSGTLAFTSDILSTIASTDDVPEGSNLYFTNERVDDRVNGLIVDGAGITKTYDDVANTYTLDIDATVALLESPSFTGTVGAVNLTLSGDLTVSGTTTTINSTTVTVDDKNLELGSVASPTDITAAGGGITLKGATDKTLTWLSATTSWTSSENLDLVAGKVLKIAGTSVLSGSALGSGVTGSSLTSVGTISSGTWTGTAIAVADGGTGSTTASNARTALGLAIGSDVQAYNSTLAAVAGSTYTGDDAITTLGTIATGVWSGTEVAVNKGGTGSTTASNARTALGLAIDSDVQAYNSTLAAVAGATYTGSASITTLGTIATGTWSATTIALNKGGTGATTQATAAIAILPSQGAASGKYLTSNGTDVAWATVDALPSQTNYSGFYLTTNGSSASWAAITTDPIPQVLMLGGM